MPTVSVIVPNYNHAPYLEQRIDSILHQTYQDFELILLDDCSTDHSQSLLESYKKHPKLSHLVFNQTNSGSTFKQWHKGVELAQGKYIWIAESDDWASPDFLETIMQEFSQNDKVGLAYTHSQLIDSQGQTTYTNDSNNTQQIITYQATQYIEQKLTTKNSIWNASMMLFRKSLYPSKNDQQLYGSMKYCGDWFFYVLLCSQNIEVVEIKKTLNHYRIHDKNVSTKALEKGLAFLEGLSVLKHIQQTYKLPIMWRQKMAIQWAKQLSIHQKTNQYTAETKQKIIRKLKKEQPYIYLLYCIYDQYYHLKTKKNDI